ncbi:MAG: peptide ABC transporter substrate-binding protein [Clostridium sp.]|jgi:oligopeptide transport system substrate-binding protein|uniref:peptide ABC transporter substrate-binding protein n=1 Tax=Clostridium sp. TaxID=1506 RepID=UPI0025BFBCED|nr:peptide ABC transporter substrate-binding protein [Clostridium sp.]MCH3965913.1 peptide ABC transporter substrate-binding protein [Clostridium sp.]MCI1715998.1 peptide ABC transporter substrate-binding protein [Clostridium sp.]MCI1800330.1 peptide ABC transporter substrate-binding protein [Clostridium sp.]MCI1814175.1 peptide ABC transporter substrate-binding protein [Clostridium sp.]MCI1871074.1 peptide ABC transporter substrate-binding protein [Clostridium sp.]
MLKGKSRISSIVLSLVLVGSIFAGCGNSTSKGSDKSTIKVNISADPKSIDPGLCNTIEGAHVIENAFEGLTDMDGQGKIQPGVAEKWDVSSDGLTYTFHLRKNAKWSDGKAVTAKDFEYAWKRALNPKTASEYAYQLYYLKNGQAYNEGKVGADQVGIKAKDDYTLVANLQDPTPYFLYLTSFTTYKPIRKDAVDKSPDAWATKADTYISNGPYKMVEYKQKDSLNFEKNPNYWDAKNVKIERVEFKTLENASSYYAAFKTGDLDLIDKPPATETPNLLKNGTAKAYPYFGVYYYMANVSPQAASVNPEAAKVLGNVKVRKALSLAIDRSAIVKDVTKSGEKPATSFVPGVVSDSNGGEFKNKEYLPEKADIAQARKLLAEAGYPDGKGFPTLEVLYNTDQTNQNIAQAVQDMWKKNLKINITLRNVERKIQISELLKHNFVVGGSRWIADYNDPMTFLDMFTTTGGNNMPGYSNPSYDKLIGQAKSEPDTSKRAKLIHQAEDILMNDAPVIPIYEYSEVVCINKKLKGVQITPIGSFILKGASLQE